MIILRRGSKQKAPDRSRGPWGSDQLRVMQQTTGLATATPRGELIRRYLGKLCPPNLVLGKEDFLGQGNDEGGKGDYQGCGEFNPTLLFSAAEQQDFEKPENRTARDDANAENRRVTILLFRPGSRVAVEKWPCPRAAEGTTACRKRFWSDGEGRRSLHLPTERRTFGKSRDTFACRFYHRMMSRSPCEDSGRRLFRYCLEELKDLPWPDDALFRVISRDGARKFEFKVSAGRPVASGREFLLSDVEQGVEYKGEVLAHKLVLGVFGFCELFRIEDPGDPLNILPLPEQLQPEHEVDPEPLPPLLASPAIEDDLDLDSPKDGLGPGPHSATTL